MENQQEIVDGNKELNIDNTQEAAPSNEHVDVENAENVHMPTETLENGESISSDDDLHDEDDKIIEDILENPNLSKGEAKRFLKLAQINRELKSQLADAVTKRNELEGTNRAPAQNQVQQFDPTTDQRLNPQSPNFDFEFYTDWKLEQKLAQRDQKKWLEEQRKIIGTDLQKVENSIQRAKISDPQFANLWEQYGHLINQDLKYGLADLEKPHLFLKHLFKNEKDVLTLQNLGTRHPSEQVRRMTALGLKFEHNNGISNGSVPSTSRKVAPIPQLGNKRGSTSSYNNGYSPDTQTWDPNFVNRFIS